MFLKCVEVVLDPGLKGGQGWGCGNSFREAIPLGDGEGEENLMSVQGPVVGNIKRNMSWFGGGSSGFLLLETYLELTFSRPCLSLYSLLSLAFFRLDGSDGQSSSSSLAFFRLDGSDGQSSSSSLAFRLDGSDGQSSSSSLAFLRLDGSDGQSSSSSMAVTLDAGL